MLKPYIINEKFGTAGANQTVNFRRKDILFVPESIKIKFTMTSTVANRQPKLGINFNGAEIFAIGVDSDMTASNTYFCYFTQNINVINHSTQNVINSPLPKIVIPQDSSFSITGYIDNYQANDIIQYIQIYGRYTE